MSALRNLLVTAKAQGWQHVVYSYLCQREHVWRSGDAQVAYEPAITRLSISQRRPRPGTAGRPYVEILAATVISIEQVVALLAAYGLSMTPTVAHVPAEDIQPGQIISDPERPRVLVLRVNEAYTEKVGPFRSREIRAHWGRRLDTGVEGWMPFGPGGQFSVETSGGAS